MPKGQHTRGAPVINHIDLKHPDGPPFLKPLDRGSWKCCSLDRFGSATVSVTWKALLREHWYQRSKNQFIFWQNWRRFLQVYMYRHVFASHCICMLTQEQASLISQKVRIEKSPKWWSVQHRTLSILCYYVYGGKSIPVLWAEGRLVCRDHMVPNPAWQVSR